MKAVLGVALCFMVAFGRASAATNGVEFVVDAAKDGGPIDLTCFALGQGGLSPKPMFDGDVEQIKQLHPQTIRVFVQEYFDLYPAHGQYHWATLDRLIETVLATGAKPILCLCFKPPVLFPRIDHHTVHPTDYDEWEELIFQLVKHCNEEKQFGIKYWEVANEPDIGESGGCPYLFQPGDYVVYYSRTAEAIRRADPAAKVGGPALSDCHSAIGDALIEHCGNSETPLDFFSWHAYANGPGFFRKTIRDVKAKLARFPRLKDCETILDEWNMSLGRPEVDPAYQPAFILQSTIAFLEEGLSRSAYYHMQDVYVDETVFSKFLSPGRVGSMARWWNAGPQYNGLWDRYGRLRPAYFAFEFLGLIRGRRVPVPSPTNQVYAIAAIDGHALNSLVWYFPVGEQRPTRHVTLRFPSSTKGRFRQIHLNASAPRDELELRRYGSVAALTDEPIEMDLEPYDIWWVLLEH